MALSFLQLKARLRSNHVLKERFIRLLVQGESENNIRQLSEQFHATYLLARLNKDVFQALSGHNAAGDHVYLVSSNFDFFLEPLRAKWNLKGIFATRTEVEGGKFTGKLLGHTCAGKEKLERVLATFGESQLREAVAYGDSRDDLFLLSFVKNARWVGARRNLKDAHPSRAA